MARKRGGATPQERAGETGSSGGASAASSLLPRGRHGFSPVGRASAVDFAARKTAFAAPLAARAEPEGPAAFARDVRGRIHLPTSVQAAGPSSALTGAILSRYEAPTLMPARGTGEVAGDREFQTLAVRMGLADQPARRRRTPTETSIIDTKREDALPSERLSSEPGELGEPNSFAGRHLPAGGLAEDVPHRARPPRASMPLVREPIETAIGAGVRPLPRVNPERPLIRAQPLAATGRQELSDRTRERADWRPSLLADRALPLTVARPAAGAPALSEDDQNDHGVEETDAPDRPLRIHEAASAAPYTGLRELSGLVDSIQRKAVSGAETPEAPRRALALTQVATSVGQPLEPPTQRVMETALGANLADVRVHTDGPAAGAASSLGAHAFTMGNSIYFAEGAFQPAAADGLALLGHEVVHTMQQQAGSRQQAGPQRRAMVTPDDMDVTDQEPPHLENQALSVESLLRDLFARETPGGRTDPVTFPGSTPSTLDAAPSSPAASPPPPLPLAMTMAPWDRIAPDAASTTLRAFPSADNPAVADQAGADTARAGREDDSPTSRPPGDMRGVMDPAGMLVSGVSLGAQGAAIGRGAQEAGADQADSTQDMAPDGGSSARGVGALARTSGGLPGGLLIDGAGAVGLSRGQGFVDTPSGVPSGTVERDAEVRSMADHAPEAGGGAQRMELATDNSVYPSTSAGEATTAGEASPVVATGEASPVVTTGETRPAGVASAVAMGEAWSGPAADGGAAARTAFVAADAAQPSSMLVSGVDAWSDDSAAGAGANPASPVAGMPPPRAVLPLRTTAVVEEAERGSDDDDDTRMASGDVRPARERAIRANIPAPVGALAGSGAAGLIGSASPLGLASATGLPGPSDLAPPDVLASAILPSSGAPDPPVGGIDDTSVHDGSLMAGRGAALPPRQGGPDIMTPHDGLTMGALSPDATAASLDALPPLAVASGGAQALSRDIAASYPEPAAATTARDGSGAGAPDGGSVRSRSLVAGRRSAEPAEALDGYPGTGAPSGQDLSPGDVGARALPAAPLAALALPSLMVANLLADGNGGGSPGAGVSGEPTGILHNVSRIDQSNDSDDNDDDDGNDHSADTTSATRGTGLLTGNYTDLPRALNGTSILSTNGDTAGSDYIAGPGVGSPASLPARDRAVRGFGAGPGGMAPAALLTSGVGAFDQPAVGRANGRDGAMAGDQAPGQSLLPLPGGDEVPAGRAGTPMTALDSMAPAAMLTSGIHVLADAPDEMDGAAEGGWGAGAGSDGTLSGMRVAGEPINGVGATRAGSGANGVGPAMSLGGSAGPATSLATLLASRADSGGASEHTEETPDQSRSGSRNGASMTQRATPAFGGMARSVELSPADTTPEPGIVPPHIAQALEHIDTLLGPEAGGTAGSAAAETEAGAEQDEESSATARAPEAEQASGPQIPSVDDLVTEVMARLKRQLMLDHDRAGGFLSHLMR